MKSISFLLFAALIFTSPVSAERIFDFTRTYASSAGAVTFNHQKHAEEYTHDCQLCHSALKVFGGTVNELFAHNYCKDCHARKTARNGPTGCSGCHPGISISMK